MFAYCGNRPINGVDQSGKWPQWVEDVTEWVKETFSQLVWILSQQGGSVGSIVYATTKAKPSSLPKTGDPGTSRTLPNPDGTPKQKRWYGPDGNAERDRDYNHPGSFPFPHDHEWKDGERGEEHLPPSPDYEISMDPLIGVGLLLVCGISIAILATDDMTGIGIADDYLMAPFVEGFMKGLILAFD